MARGNSKIGFVSKYRQAPPRSMQTNNKLIAQVRPIHGGNRQWAGSLAGITPEQILDFSASINPLGPPKSAIAAIQSHLSDLNHYPDREYRLL